jgi:hypothetical protein
MQKKLALLQQKWDGDNLEDQNDVESGDWSPENLAKNRAAYIKEQNPWVSYGMSCSEWYEKIVKPKMKGTQAA